MDEIVLAGPAPLPPQQEVTLLIANVAALTGVPTPQLRSWEQAGLLHPRRSPNGVRLYGIEEVARVRLIKRSLDNPGRRGSLRRLLAQLAAGTLRPLQEDYAGLTGPATMSDALYWQAVVDAMADLVVVCDRHGRLTSMNPALRRVLSAPAAESPESGERAPNPPPDRIPEGLPLPSALEALPLRWSVLTGTQHRDVPLLFRNADGAEHRTMWTVTALRDTGGALAGAVGVGRIVPHDPATRSEDWLAMAVHDLRSPVTVIQGRLELARRAMPALVAAVAPAGADREATKQVTRHLTAAELSTNDLIRVMDTLLDASAAAAGTLVQHLEPGGVRLDHLARQAVERTQQRTSRHQITLEVPEAPLLVAGDLVRLRQVFDNLLVNAVTYSPDGGPIAVQLEVLESVPVESLDLPAWLAAAVRNASAANQPWTTAGWVLVRVADEGLGIPAAAVPYVFDRFWRAEGGTARIRGTGLGLYACRAIAAAHGGHIWVERSAPAVEGDVGVQWHGTVMAMLLPLVSVYGTGAVDTQGAAVVPGASVG